MKTKIALNEAYKTKAYCVKCESKVMISPEVHGEFMNRPCKFLETIHGNKMLSFWYFTSKNYAFMRRAFCAFTSTFS